LFIVISFVVVVVVVVVVHHITMKASDFCRLSVMSICSLILVLHVVTVAVIVDFIC